MQDEFQTSIQKVKNPLNILKSYLKTPKIKENRMFIHKDFIK